MSQHRPDVDPLIPASTVLPEFTFKVILLCILLAAVMSAANAYLALKIGQTISASIPASVLAIGILRFFKNSNVLQSNLIQTAASAGEGVAASISFVLPAMLFIHAWKGFDYWETAAITAFGGLLGVFFSIPLRRVMLSMKTLPFPEGTAVGKVLRVTAQSRAGATHMKRLVQGISVGGLMAFAQSGIQIFSDSIHSWFRVGKSVFGAALGFSPALFAAGYIVGIQVGASLFTGFILGWVIVLPILAAHMGGIPAGKSVYDSVMSIWSTHLRFVGVGVMLVGGVWTLIRLIKPVFDGIKVSFSALNRIDSKRAVRTELDIPIIWAFLGVIICLLALYTIVQHYAYAERLFCNTTPDLFLLCVGLFSILYLLVIGFFISTICAYFTGLVGSSNNPLSGLIILSILILGVIYFFLFPGHHNGKVAALMVIVTTVIATAASISNENLQDLKAGQMVGATPWKQQVVLGIGVIVSALIIGPVLELLLQAYGMGGVFPHAGMDPSQMLTAPQAGLMASVIQGIRTQDLPWPMIITGCGIAVGVIIVDEIIRRRHGRRLPALAVGLGIYLPPSIILPTVVGGVVRFISDRVGKKHATTEDKKAKAEEAHENGLLLACGLVAGAALMGVILAIPFVLMGSSNALSIMPDSLSGLAHFLGLISFVAMAVWMYKVSRYKK